MKNASTDYPIIRNKPVARFRYKGSHSKAVRREVIITNMTSDVLTGYTTRDGNDTFDLSKAPIRSFSRDKVIGLERLSLSDAGLTS